MKSRARGLGAASRACGLYLFSNCSSVHTSRSVVHTVCGRSCGRIHREARRSAGSESSDTCITVSLSVELEGTRLGAILQGAVACTPGGHAKKVPNRAPT
eukprot:7388513-Prymnesium_polylepis.2